jgi:hypothetical protein
LVLILKSLKILNNFENRSTNAAAKSFISKIEAFRASIRGGKNVSFFLFRLYQIFMRNISSPQVFGLIPKK